MNNDSEGNVIKVPKYNIFPVYDIFNPDRPRDPLVQFDKRVRENSAQARVYDVELSAHMMAVRGNQITHINEQMLFEQMVNEMDELSVNRQRSYRDDWRLKVK